MMTQEEMAGILRGMITERRFVHSLGVQETAIRLAKLYGADERKCSIAGLVHDCAKSMSTSEQMEAIARGGIRLFDGEETVTEVLHAPAGAVIAKEVFGINDAEILSAIRFHTIGSPQMTLTEAIIYLADYIEPNRKMHDGLQVVRDLAEKDVFAACMQAKKNTEAYCASVGNPAFVFSKTSQSNA